MIMVHFHWIEQDCAFVCFCTLSCVASENQALTSKSGVMNGPLKNEKSQKILPSLGISHNLPMGLGVSVILGFTNRHLNNLTQHNREHMLNLQSNDRVVKVTARYLAAVGKAKPPLICPDRSFWRVL